MHDDMQSFDVEEISHTAMISIFVLLYWHVDINNKINASVQKKKPNRIFRPRSVYYLIIKKDLALFSKKRRVGSDQIQYLKSVCVCVCKSVKTRRDDEASCQRPFSQRPKHKSLCWSAETHGRELERRSKAAIDIHHYIARWLNKRQNGPMEKWGKMKDVVVRVRRSKSQSEKRRQRRSTSKIR